MKNLLRKASAGAGLLLLNASSAFAAGSGFFSNPFSGAPPDAVNQDTLGNSITTIINYLLGILGLIAVAFLIYAGVLMVTAGGNEDNITKAKNIITYALIGIVLIILSWTIVSFVTNVLG